MDEMCSHVFVSVCDLGVEGWDSLLALGSASMHFHARTAISASRVVRPNGLELGVALAFLGADIVNGDEEESQLYLAW